MLGGVELRVQHAIINYAQRWLARVDSTAVKWRGLYGYSALSTFVGVRVYSGLEVMYRVDRSVDGGR